MHTKIRSGKVTVIGAGSVGATSAYAMFIDGAPSEITLIDVSKEKAEGEAMDLEHGMQFVPNTKLTYGTDYKLVKDAEIVVITAGARTKPGQTRLELITTNAGILKNIINQVKKYNKDCILLIVSNPVDILTYLAWKYSGFPRERVFGSGTTLDSARLRYYVGQKIKVHPNSIHAYMLGEHGDSEFPAWSSARVGGVPIADFKEINTQTLHTITESTRKAAYEIIARKGATYYAIGLVVSQLVRAILDDSSSVYPLSVVLKNYHGISDVALSVPAVLKRDGADVKFELPLSTKEKKQFVSSARVLHTLIQSL